MKRTAYRSLILLILALILASCGDVAILNPVDSEGPALEVKSLDQGGTVDKGEPLVFTITSPSEEETPTRLDIGLFAADGSVISSQSIDEPEIGEDITLQLPDLSTGRYRIEFTLYGKDSVLLEQELTFFYTTESYVIQGIESFPPVNPPGSNVLLTVLLDVPEGSDPYIRWKQGKNLLARGLLSEGIANIYWAAPKEDGVYSISAELFPVPPLEGTNYTFESSSIMKTELYISSSKSHQNHNFTPRESYYSLFHLNGSLADSGAGFPESGLLDAKEIGRLEPAAHENILGYRFSDSTGFSVPRFILPVEYEALNPFTLSLGISVDALSQGARIVTIQSEDGVFSMALDIGEDLRPAATLKIGPQSFLMPSGFPDLQIQKRYILSLSVQPDPEARSFKANWFLDGLRYGSFTFEEVTLAGLAGKGKTTIGGKGGFSGILDEIGVYYRDGEGNPSVDPSLF